MLSTFAIISFVIDILILLILVSQLTKSGRFISKKSAIYLIPTFINVYMLFLVGIKFSGQNGLDSSIYAVQYSVLTFALRFNFDIVRQAIESSQLYYLAFYLSVGFAALTTVIVVVAFILGKFVNKLKTIHILRNPIIVIGYNEDARIFYDSIKSRAKYFIIPNDEEIIRICLRDNIKYFIDSHNIYTRFLKKNQQAQFVSFLDDGFKEIELIEEFKSLSLKYNNSKYDLKVMVESDNVSTYQAIVGNHSHIFILSEDILVSKKCLLDHQITNYMDENQIDYKTATINKDTDISIFMIGFGPINSTIYTQSLISNQFVKLNGEYEAYAPSYYILDDLHKLDNRQINYNLNHRDELKDEDYFPLPEPIEHTTYYNIGIENSLFYHTIYNNLKDSKSSDMRVIYVSYGDELLNIDIAIKLNQKIKEWKLKGTYKIFVHVMHNNLKEIDELNKFSSIILFGSKEEIITYPIIVEDFLDEYAKRRALYYEISNKNPDCDLDDIIKRLEENESTIVSQKNEIWSKLNSYQKKSNISSVLSIFSKLNMLGLEVTHGLDNTISEEEYKAIYDSEKILKTNSITYFVRDGKNHTSPRNALAYMEHLRWNAFMLVEGYIPMPKKDIKVEVVNGKVAIYKNDVELRVHSCITTDKGLEDYFEFMTNLITKETGMSKAEAFDMIENKKYDYMLMDTVYTDIRIMNQGIKKK